MFSREGIERNANIVFDLTKFIILPIIVLFVVHYFIATIFVIDGRSMEPTLENGQIVMVNKLAYLSSTPKRGDIVVVRFPGDPDSSKYIKRIIGMPGEQVEVKNGQVFINQRQLSEVYLASGTVTVAQEYKNLKLEEKEYYLIGDNRDNSSDSRIWGQARLEDLIGRTRFILYPFNDGGFIADVFYK